MQRRAAEGVTPMHTLKHLGLCALGVALVSAVGCNKVADSDPHTARNESSASTVSAAQSSEMTPASRTRSAAEQIAQARCEREQQCGNIGRDKTFSSSQDCFLRIENDWKDELSARQCPGGINQKELNECMGQVRAEACSNPFDTLARITECTSAQICIEQP
jgi:hypothetical protein